MSVESVTIRDPSSGALAEILTGFGFNCHRFQAWHDGQPVEVLWSEEGFASGEKRPSGSGIPILFPFPGRIRGTAFVWDDKTYTLEDGDGRGNAIHGFVHCRPWRVVESSEQRVVGEFHASRDEPELANRWPADFRIRATYEIQSNLLRCAYRIENPGQVTLPCGFGVHPYFQLPLAAAGEADHCRIRLPVTAEWELAEMNATGNRLPLERADSFRAGVPFGDLSLDNVFTGLAFERGTCTASIHDPASGREMVLRFDDSFRECVVYNPPHRRAICIEPYTCVPDCFRLCRDGIDAGMRLLGPGESFAAEITIELR
jgi:aldose 1-epimerase